MIHIYNDQENKPTTFSANSNILATNKQSQDQGPVGKVSNGIKSSLPGQFTGINVKNSQNVGSQPAPNNNKADDMIAAAKKPLPSQQPQQQATRKPLDQKDLNGESGSVASGTTEGFSQNKHALSLECQQEIHRLGGTITAERKYRTYKMPGAIAEFVNIHWKQKWFYSQQYNVKVEMVGYFRLYPEDYQHMPLLLKHKDEHYLIADGDGCLMVLSHDETSDPTIYVAGDEDTLGIYPFNMPIKLSKFLSTLKPVQSTSSALLNEIIPAEDKMQIDQTPSATPATATASSADSPRIDDLYENDAQDVTEYVRDIMSLLKTREKSHQVINHDYLKTQEKITNNMRFVLVDWLLEVHRRIKLFPETIYLCVNIMDRFLEKTPNVSKGRFQLVGATALFIASKYEDIYHITIGDLTKLCAEIYTREDFLTMESLMLSTLDYNLTVVTSWPFIERFVRCADCSDKAQLMTYYFSELAFLDEKFLKFEPSRIASSCIYLSRMMDSVRNPWDSVMKYYSGYEKEDLLECSRLLLHMAKKEPKGLNKKYQKQKYMHLAHYVPKLARSIEL